MKSIRVALLTLTLATVASSASANLITNGSFETGVNPGVLTTLGAGSGSISNWDILARQRRLHRLVLAGRGRLAQRRPQRNVVWQDRPDVRDRRRAGLHRALRHGGQSGRRPAAQGPRGGGWRCGALVRVRHRREDAPEHGVEYHEFGFTATSVSTTLSFLSSSTANDSCNCYGAALDDVSVDVPEPLTLMLLGSGIAAFAGASSPLGTPVLATPTGPWSPWGHGLVVYAGVASTRQRVVRARRRPSITRSTSSSVV